MNRKYLKYGAYAVGGLAAVYLGAKLLGGNASANASGASGSTDLGSTLGVPFASPDLAGGPSGPTATGAATGSTAADAVQAEINALLSQLNNPMQPATGDD